MCVSFIGHKCGNVTMILTGGVAVLVEGLTSRWLVLPENHQQFPIVVCGIFSATLVPSCYGFGSH